MEKSGKVGISFLQMRTRENAVCVCMLVGLMMGVCLQVCYVGYSSLMQWNGSSTLTKISTTMSVGNSFTNSRYLAEYVVTIDSGISSC